MAIGLYSLSDLYQNRLFRVPDYQRGYAWKHEQLVDFWEDLINLHEGRYHYTGLLSLKLVSPDDSKNWDDDKWIFETGYKPYHIVDGQQRLTTFSILIFEIVKLAGELPENKDKAKEEILLGFESLARIKEKYISRKKPPHNISDTYMFGYEEDNPSAEYLKHRIFASETKYVLETFYTKNLAYAQSFFAENLYDLYQKEGFDSLERLYRILTQNLKFNLHEIEDDYDVFVAFETMNNRGKRLTNLELLKNRLIYLATLFDDTELDLADKERLRSNINEAWKEVYYQLGRSREVSLSDDEFLRAHWITNFQYSRRRGSDYIEFLLDKFSAKNIFEKHPVQRDSAEDDTLSDFAEEVSDDYFDSEDSFEPSYVSKLAPREINDYVSSLQTFSQHWYCSWFPSESGLTNEEIQWLERINRLGIGYFRPLIAAVLAKSNNSTQQDRVAFFKAVERFIFVLFRLGDFRSNYQNTVYYKKAREVFHEEVTVASITEELHAAVVREADSSVETFLSRMSSRFDSGQGFYTWGGLRYFLYEYEHEKAVRNNLDRIDLALFSKAEGDKVTIEHILPQTPSNWYWQNTFRAYTLEEIRILSASLGNLLPLSQSINSSLQNDSFPDKKNPKSSKRRGYINGSHSEIEVAQNEVWDAERIRDRGLMLLKFMEERWHIAFSDEQKEKLLHISFINEEREFIPEIQEVEIAQDEESSGEASNELNDGNRKNLDFWENFSIYCEEHNRGNDIALRQPWKQFWYDLDVGSHDYRVSFRLYSGTVLGIAIYVFNPEAYERLLSKKDELEKEYESSLTWGAIRKGNRAKSVTHKIKADTFNPYSRNDNFNWLITQFDLLVNALKTVDPDGFS